jgi:hypothetical protein
VYPLGGEVFGTVAFGSRFDADAPFDECQAVSGDSGGAAFAWGASEGGFELAGVVIGIVQYPGQPAGTTIHGQLTYYADLSYYREEILGVMPEPSGGFWVGAALVDALRRRRNRRAPPPR